MDESYYQSKIMKGIEAIGGHVVNGKYTKSGEGDLQGGWPLEGVALTPLADLAIADELGTSKTITVRSLVLLHIVVEVKTPKDYERVMKCLDEVDGRYIIKPGVKGLKKHEPLQIHKINEVRNRGGLALIAWNFEQVKKYVEENT